LLSQVVRWLGFNHRPVPNKYITFKALQIQRDHGIEQKDTMHVYRDPPVGVTANAWLVIEKENNCITYTGTSIKNDGCA
jgi:hypothetical protein